MLSSVTTHPYEDIIMCKEARKPPKNKNFFFFFFFFAKKICLFYPVDYYRLSSRSYNKQQEEEG